MFDVVIVGYGPAGITAAIYAARKKHAVLLVGDFPGGEVRNSGAIENWPGDGETDGNALADKLIAHLKLHADDITVKQEEIAVIFKNDAGFATTTRSGMIIESRTVIYAAGRHPRPLNIPGESEFRNRGVTYCATCDAPLFPNKEVAVIGGGNSGAEAVIMLQKIAKKIHLLHIDGQLNADAILVRNFIRDKNVVIHYNAKTTAIGGQTLVNSLTYKDTATGEVNILPVEGIFVTIGAIPNTEPVNDLVKLNNFGAVVTDRYGQTNIPGFFAAGDVTDFRDAQIVVAAGQGCSAALSVSDYLSRQTAQSQ